MCTFKGLKEDEIKKKCEASAVERGDFSGLTEDEIREYYCGAATDKEKQIGLTRDEIKKSRFFGASNVRDMQIRVLEADVEDKTGKKPNYQAKTIDALNRRIGITGELFTNEATLGIIRTKVKKAIKETAKKEKNREAKMWGEWLDEESRFNALMMWEMNGEECRRDRKLDQNVQNSRIYTDTTKKRDFQTQKIDEKKKIIYKGDNNRRDDEVHWINSGQVRNGYTIYWMQEGCGTDDTREEASQSHSYSWTEELKKLHNNIINAEKQEDGLKYVREFYNEAKKESCKDNESQAKNFTDTIIEETHKWLDYSVQNRFFRLTSLMGMDFFVNRGKTVRFAHDRRQGKYTKGRVNRTITDSEWAHAKDMGYLTDGSVIRYDTTDRFRLIENS